MKRALIVIDVQESFRRRPIWSPISHPEIVKSVQRQVDSPAPRAT